MRAPRPTTAPSGGPVVCHDGTAEATAAIVVGDVELDVAGSHVSVRGRTLQLPVRAFLLLRCLMDPRDRSPRPAVAG
ncbi:hypothetical protein [Streptomyces sp. NPDC057877]|uniref:hypothetical protein n=1 Tax=Streptomyces sp. NPDC057877 TaxID=3346269 RepID=UPI0036CA1887